MGGKVKAEESYQDAAVREMAEESKIYCSLELAAISKVDLPEEKAIAHIFVPTEEIKPEQLQLDPEEIEYVQAFSIEEISIMIKNNHTKFAPTFVQHFLQFKEQYQRLNNF